MKSCVAIALIIAGTVLVVAPFLHNAIGTAQVAKVMTELSKDVHFTVDIPEFYYTVCMVAGLAIIVIGAIGAWKSKAA